MGIVRQTYHVHTRFLYNWARQRLKRGWLLWEESHTNLQNVAAPQVAS